MGLVLKLSGSIVLRFFFFVFTGVGKEIVFVVKNEVFGIVVVRYFNAYVAFVVVLS